MDLTCKPMKEKNSVDGTPEKNKSPSAESLQVENGNPTDDFDLGFANENMPCEEQRGVSDSESDVATERKAINLEKASNSSRMADSDEEVDLEFHDSDLEFMDFRHDSDISVSSTLDPLEQMELELERERSTRRKQKKRKSQPKERKAKKHKCNCCSDDSRDKGYRGDEEDDGAGGHGGLGSLAF